MTQSRRRVLKRGSAVIGTVSLVGCLGGGTETDAGTGTERATVEGSGGSTAGDGESTATAATTGTEPPASERPATDVAGYTEWLPAPSAVEFVPETGYAFRATAPAQVVELADALGQGVTEPLTRELQVPGMETLADATTVVQLLRSAFVYEAAVDPDAVERGFEDLGFTAVDTYRDFTVLTPDSSDDTRAAAVGDGVVLTVGRFASSDDVAKRPAVETIIDAKAGTAERYTDAVPDCGHLADALGHGHFVTGRTHDAGATFDGAVSEGTSLHVGETDSRVRASVVFADAADENAVAEWARDASTFYGTAPSTRVDGRVVIAVATVSSDTVTEVPVGFPGPAIREDGPDAPPQVSFGFEYDSATNSLRIRHEAGDSVPVEALFVRGSGFVDPEGVDQTSAGQWQGTVGGDGRVVAGDEVVVGAAPGYEVRIEWEAGDGDAATLASDEGPEA
jgi:hypothetical protein